MTLARNGYLTGPDNSGKPSSSSASCTRCHLPLSSFSSPGCGLMDDKVDARFDRLEAKVDGLIMTLARKGQLTDPGDPQTRMTDSP